MLVEITHEVLVFPYAIVLKVINKTHYQIPDRE